MLPKKYRLTGKEIENLKDNGRVISGKYFGLVVFDRKDSHLPRIGFIVSSKIAKRAVDRNRIKRYLRNSVSRYLPRINKGFNLLFLANKSIKDVSQDELEEEVKETLTSREIIK